MKLTKKIILKHFSSHPCFHFEVRKLRTGWLYVGDDDFYGKTIEFGSDQGGEPFRALLGNINRADKFSSSSIMDSRNWAYLWNSSLPLLHWYFRQYDSCIKSAFSGWIPSDPLEIAKRIRELSDSFKIKNKSLYHNLDLEVFNDESHHCLSDKKSLNKLSEKEFLKIYQIYQDTWKDGWEIDMLSISEIDGVQKIFKEDGDKKIYLKSFYHFFNLPIAFYLLGYSKKYQEGHYWGEYQFLEGNFHLFS